MSLNLQEIGEIEFEYVMLDKDNGGTEAPILKAWYKDGTELTSAECDELQDDDDFIYEWLSERMGW